jgi:thiol-disulfide isomerase/thioredoxin
MAVATPFVPFPFNKPDRVVEPVPPEETPRDADKVSVPILPNVEKKFVDEAVLAKKEVVVAFVVVELPVTVKLPRMVEEAPAMYPEESVDRPETDRLPSVPILVSDVSEVTPGIT